MRCLNGQNVAYTHKRKVVLVVKCKFGSSTSSCLSTSRSFFSLSSSLSFDGSGRAVAVSYSTAGAVVRPLTSSGSVAQVTSSRTREVQKAPRYEARRGQGGCLHRRRRFHCLTGKQRTGSEWLGPRWCRRQHGRHRFIPRKLSTTAVPTKAAKASIMFLNIPIRP